MKYPLFFLLLWGQLFAQSPIVSAEYFIDGPDPGYGNATAFAPFASDTLISATDQINLSNLSPGVHQWSVRVKDDQGVWSHTYTRSFLLLAWDNNIPLQGGEWFWDQDPGFGQGNSFGLSGTQDSLSWLIQLDTLPPGIHDLYVRVQNINGIWSHTFRRNTFIRAEPAAPIDRLSYYFVGPDSNSSTFTYILSQPQHFVDISFNPDAGDLVDSTTYEICVRAIRTDSVESCERCTSFLYQTEDSMSTNLQTLSQAPLRLYPNPNRGQFWLNMPPHIKGNIHLEVFDIQGKQVYQHLYPDSSQGDLAVEIDNLTPGVYFVLLEWESSIWVQRILIE
ncbi:MAG: T9SS type A sorting domain-containing protein [Bacteroidota bacterium]